MVTFIFLGFLLFFNLNLADIQNYFFGDKNENANQKNSKQANKDTPAQTIKLNKKELTPNNVFKKVKLPTKQVAQEITINTISLKNSNKDKEDFGLDINLKKNSDQARVPPKVNLLKVTKEDFKVNEKEIRLEAEKIKEKLAKFNIPVQMVDVNI